MKLIITALLVMVIVHDSFAASTESYIRERRQETIKELKQHTTSQDRQIAMSQLAYGKTANIIEMMIRHCFA